MTRALDLFDLSEGYTNLTTALSRAEANFPTAVLQLRLAVRTTAVDRDT